MFTLLKVGMRVIRTQHEAGTACGVYQADGMILVDLFAQPDNMDIDHMIKRGDSGWIAPDGS